MTVTRFLLPEPALLFHQASIPLVVLSAPAQNTGMAWHSMAQHGIGVSPLAVQSCVRSKAGPLAATSWGSLIRWVVTGIVSIGWQPFTRPSPRPSSCAQGDQQLGKGMGREEKEGGAVVRQRIGRAVPIVRFPPAAPPAYGSPSHPIDPHRPVVVHKRTLLGQQRLSTGRPDGTLCRESTAHDTACIPSSPPPSTAAPEDRRRRRR